MAADPKPIPAPGCHPARRSACPACAGRGCQPTAAGRLEPCGPCKGTGVPCVVGDLGGTRSHPKGRPFEYDPATREALVSRGRKVTKYRLDPFAASWDRAGVAVRVTKFDALDQPCEVRDVWLDRAGCHSCDCEGTSYASTERFDRLARFRGEGPVGRSLGCVHLDLVRLLHAAGWLDVRPLQPAPAPLPVDADDDLPDCFRGHAAARALSDYPF